jgi:hypothetical protein
MRLILVKASLLIISVIFSSLSLAGTYIENFDDGDFDGWEILNVKGGVSEWKVENGILKCTRNNVWISSIVFGEEEWRNYSIECDAKMIQVLDPQLHAMGVDLRRMDDLSIVWCAIGDSTKWALLEVWLNGNNPAKHGDKRFDFQIDQWYHLKGVANEGNFEFYVDGELFVSLSDSSLPTGRVGLSAGSCVAQFDNVVITGDDVPNNTAAVSASGRLTAKWGQLRSQ